jgi:hypothetical protein
MKVRLLTDGGYGLRHDEMSKVYEAKKKNSSYIITIDGIEMYFYADEVEVIQDYFLETAEDKAALKYLVISIIATILCVAAIILVIF